MLNDNFNSNKPVEEIINIEKKDESKDIKTNGNNKIGLMIKNVISENQDKYLQSQINSIQNDILQLNFNYNKLKEEIKNMENKQIDSIRKIKNKIFDEDNKEIESILIGARVTTSSSWDQNLSGNNCGLNFPSSWCAAINDDRQWIQVNYEIKKTFVSVSTQGRGNYGQWVTKYNIEYSDDCKKWKIVEESPFTGNYDTSTIVTHRFVNPFEAYYVRLVPIEWYSHISLRWELYCIR